MQNKDLEANADSYSLYQCFIYFLEQEETFEGVSESIIPRVL